MIPEAAVEALREQIDAIGIYLSPKYARAALEAAAPHMLAASEARTAGYGELLNRVEELCDGAANIHGRLALRDEIRELLRPSP